MYLIKIYEDHNDQTGTVIHSPYVNDLKISEGKVNIVLGSIHDFEFSINIKNPAWSRIRPFKTLIEVKDMFRNKAVFEGRILQPRSRMDSDGTFVKNVVAESYLSYLVDSTQRHAEIHDTTVEDFLQIIINNHNMQVEAHKRFKVGRVTITNTTDNVYRYLGYDNSYETIKDKLVDRLGGYILCRKEENGLYIDYLSEEDIGEYVADTPIKLAKNMQNVTYEIDPTEVITRLVPLGMQIDSEDEDATDASKARLTISEVNDGVDYLDDEDLIAEFGIIERSMIWDDVTTPGRLLTNGKNFFKGQKTAIAKFEVNATNSHLLESELTAIEVGNIHDLINPVIGLNERVRVIGQKLDINSPQKSSLTIGNKKMTLTEYQAKTRTTEKEVIELRSTVKNQSKRIVAIRQELQNVDTVLQDLNNAIGDADIPALEDAVENLNIAVNNLTDAVDNIPDYDPATETTDGLMSANDKRKLNRITINQAINLDNLLQRVIDLEEEVFD